MNLPFRFTATFVALFMCTCLVMTLPTAIQAQNFTATLMTTANPSPYLSDWRSKRITAVLSVMNNGTTDIQGRIRAVLKRDGQAVAQTRSSMLIVQHFPTGMSTWYPETTMPESAIEYSGAEREEAARTGRLRSGLYELCLDIIDPATEQSLLSPRGPVCRSFQLIEYMSPTLVSPINNQKLGWNERPRFQWTNVTPQPTSAHYQVLVFELLAGQTPAQALRSNMPILSREVVNQSQLIWPPDVELPERLQQYVWTVRATDDVGNPCGENDGLAEPGNFIIIGEAIDLSFGLSMHWVPNPDSTFTTPPCDKYASLNPREQLLGVRDGCNLIFTVDCIGRMVHPRFFVTVEADGRYLCDLHEARSHRKGNTWSFTIPLANPAFRDARGNSPYQPGNHELKLVIHVPDDVPMLPSRGSSKAQEALSRGEPPDVVIWNPEYIGHTYRTLYAVTETPVTHDTITTTPPPIVRQESNDNSQQTTGMPVTNTITPITQQVPGPTITQAPAVPAQPVTSLNPPSSPVTTVNPVDSPPLQTPETQQQEIQVPPPEPTRPPMETSQPGTPIGTSPNPMAGPKDNLESGFTFLPMSAFKAPRTWAANEAPLRTPVTAAMQQRCRFAVTIPLGGKLFKDHAVEIRTDGISLARVPLTEGRVLNNVVYFDDVRLGQAPQENHRRPVGREIQEPQLVTPASLRLVLLSPIGTVLDERPGAPGGSKTTTHLKNAEIYVEVGLVNAAEPEMLPDSRDLPKTDPRLDPKALLSFLPMSKYKARKTWQPAPAPPHTPAGDRAYARMKMRCRFAVQLPPKMKDVTGFAVQIRVGSMIKATLQLRQGRREGDVLYFDEVKLGLAGERDVVLTLLLLNPAGKTIAQTRYAPGKRLTQGPDSSGETCIEVDPMEEPAGGRQDLKRTPR